jgi:hypothetical protein
MTDNEQVLLESQAARSSQIAQIEDRAEELLSKAKALHFNVWQETGIATTEQVAEFYEVPIKTIETVLQRNREEFNSDGLRTITSKELKELKAQTLTMKVCQITEELKPHSGFDLGRYTKSLLVWNPRATSLDFIEQAAKPKANPGRSNSRPSPTASRATGTSCRSQSSPDRTAKHQCDRNPQPPASPNGISAAADRAG